ncbi:MAG TPA: DNA helicase RecQ [Acetobacteraceae bacterium]|nr:DNA helicase RecQ [Acetobacteraceae bacterium]
MTAPGLRADPAEVLHRVFGFPAFRGLQEQVVRHVIAGGDALVLMPTGGGKSLCYQVPALCRPGTAVVISPLIALMDDQVAALRQLGVAAAALHSELDPAEAHEATRALVEGGLDLLYVSPERLLGNGMLDRLARLRLALIAIDEAHCVSQWGHEFRPEYRALAALAERFPLVPRIALTATADRRTRPDILAALNMERAAVFVASFHRPNLHIAAEPKSSETTQLLAFLARHRGECGIVYCGTRARSERIAAQIAANGLPAIAFHAGMEPEQKRTALARFRSGEPLIVCATIAFGMGIDRPDVRFVVHLDMPDSPEAFYQQIGRAGRDGERAETLLLYGGQEIALARHRLARSAVPEWQKRTMRAKLEEMIALSDTSACRTQRLLACFDEVMEQPCGHCDICESPPETIEARVEAQKVLSAVHRTGQIFGAVHVIAVLRGERTEPVLRHRHDGLSVFGIGADRPAAFWRGVIRQLVAAGALDIDVEGHGGLFLVPEKARPLLRGEASFRVRAEARPGRRPPPGRHAEPASAASAEESRRFAALRAWRAEQAKAQSVPPYVIFHDSVLRAITATGPRSFEELAAIKGVGASKLTRYGELVLAVLREEPSSPNESRAPASRTARAGIIESSDGRGFPPRGA